QQFLRRDLVSQVGRLEKARRKEERASTHEVVLFLGGVAQRRERRTKGLERLKTMFNVTPKDMDDIVDLNAVALQTQAQTTTKQQATAEEVADDEGSESEISMGSYQSGSSLLPAANGDNVVSLVQETNGQQESERQGEPAEHDIDVKQDQPEASQDRRVSAPDVVVTEEPAVTVVTESPVQETEEESGGGGISSRPPSVPPSRGESPSSDIG
ncbi:unnamed protein product, partial [Meganyctiphanes norvegica]